MVFVAANRRQAGVFFPSLSTGMKYRVRKFSASTTSGVSAMATPRTRSARGRYSLLSPRDARAVAYARVNNLVSRNSMLCFCLPLAWPPTQSQARDGGDSEDPGHGAALICPRTEMCSVSGFWPRRWSRGT